MPTPSSARSAKQVAARARCDAMVRHARDQIRALGVDSFSMNEVLRLSGGSKATLAKYFGDRTGLIAAAIAAEAQETVATLQLDTDEARSLPLRDALARALRGVLRFYLDPASLALYRAVVSAATGNADGARAFYERGHSQIVAALAGLLAARQPHEVRGGIDCADVADQLLHAIRAGAYEQRLIGLADSVPDEAVEQRIAATLALMLPGIAIAGNA